MSLKKDPLSLYSLAIQTVVKCLLQQWRNTYHTNYLKYAEELKKCIEVLIPSTIYDNIFDLMIDLHGRAIQKSRHSENDMGIVHLIWSIINSKQHKLSLGCLRHIGSVLDEEIYCLENTLMTGVPMLTNLEEICLQTSGTDFTLPTCHDELLNKIGYSCCNLISLDISYNHTVTDIGIQYLVPSESNRGCPRLVKFYIFECSVTPEGVANVLKGLPQLRFLGYKEIGQSLLCLSQNNTSVIERKLKLAHVNNLGIKSRTCKDVGKLSCDEKLVNAICTYCPVLNGLKVRISDSNVMLLKKINHLTILELVYNLGNPNYFGNGTIQYLNICGTQFVSLSLACESFSIKNLKVVCEQCNNLKNLCIRSNNFYCDHEITKSDLGKCSLLKLEILFFKIKGQTIFERTQIPHSVITYILHKSSNLKEINIVMDNSLICDSFIKALFSSIQTSGISEVMIIVPRKTPIAFALNLTMTSVETVIHMCPQLQRLGNLLVWDISLEEVQELRRQLKLSNSALDIIYQHISKETCH